VLLVATAGVVAWILHRKREGKTRTSTPTNVQKTQKSQGKV
jgi:hypothetical protein